MYQPRLTIITILLQLLQLLNEEVERFHSKSPHGATFEPRIDSTPFNYPTIVAHRIETRADNGRPLPLENSARDMSRGQVRQT